MVTYNIGTGLVIARREDGSWSPPSAISSFGIGWGAQVNSSPRGTLIPQLLGYFGHIFLASHMSFSWCILCQVKLGRKENSSLQKLLQKDNSHFYF